MVVLAIPVRGQQPLASQQAVSENQDKGETVAAHLSNKDIADMLRAGLSPADSVVRAKDLAAQQKVELDRKQPKSSRHSVSVART
jgi:hypothetical protein